MFKRITAEKLLIFIIIFIVIAIRISWFNKHFAHCDDIEVAKALIGLNNDIYSEKMMFLKGIGKDGTFLNIFSVSIYYFGKWTIGWLINIKSLVNSRLAPQRSNILQIQALHNHLILFNHL